MRVPAVLSSSKFWLRLHGSLVVFWVLLTLPAVTLWRDSVPFLVSISMCALVLGSVASWQSARADRNSPTCEDIARLERKLDSLSVRVNAVTVRRRS